MKKFSVISITVLAATAFLLFMGTGAGAVNYHTGSALVCSDCHTMHYSLDGTTPPAGADAGGPFDKMLTKTSTNGLCLVCHDNGTGADTAPDVMTTAGAGNALYRAAGAFRAAVGSASASAHNIGYLVAETAPGGTWASSASTGITCADCHNPHGTANYRNLVLKPGGVASNIAVTDITNPTTTPTADQYKVADITYGANADNNPDLSNWCSGCHTDFHAETANQSGAAWNNDANLGGDDAGATVDADSWERHPVTHVTLDEGNTNGHASYNNFANATSRPPVATTGGSVPNADNTPFCGTCHKAHGSDFDKDTNSGEPPANLIWDNPSTAALQDGTSTPQLCDTCHDKQ